MREDLVNVGLTATLRILIGFGFDLILIFGFFDLMIIFFFFNLSLFSLLVADLWLGIIVLLVHLLLHLRVHALIVRLGQELIVIDLVLLVTHLILVNLVLVLHLSLTVLGRNNFLSINGLRKFALVLTFRVTINLISNLLRRLLHTVRSRLRVLLPSDKAFLGLTLLTVFGLEIVQRCVPVVVKPLILH